MRSLSSTTKERRYSFRGPRPYILSLSISIDVLIALIYPLSLSLIDCHIDCVCTQYENVRTQLSIALALIAIQRADWTNEVQCIVDQLAKQETLDILLNVLTRLPEELYHFKIPLSTKYKDLAAANLRNHAPLVLRLLRDLFAMVSTKKMQQSTNIKVCRCMLSLSLSLCGGARMLSVAGICLTECGR